MSLPEPLETVAIVASEFEGGFILINKCDLTADDVLFDDSGEEAAGADVAVADMTIKQLRAYLKSREVAFESAANKATLLELALALPAA